MRLLLIMTKLTWYDVRGDEKRDPGYDNEKAGRQIVGDDVRHHVALENLSCAN